VLGVEDPAGAVGEREAMFIEQAVAGASLEFYRQSSLTDAELHLWGDLANAMIFDTHREHVHHYARVLGYDLDVPHRLALIAPAVDAGEALPIVQRTCRELGLTALAGRYDDHVVLVFDASQDWRELASAIRRQPRLHDLRMGVTKAWPSAERTQEMLREAELTLRVGSIVEKAPVVCFDDLGLLQLLSAANDPPSLERFVQERLGPLIENDATRGSKFVRTLSVYLDVGGALDPAAEVLFIHRSTLKYRLGRIKDLLDVNINDPEARFHLQLACRVYAVMEALRQAEATSS
jgi:sugar diacid utilization regulator